MALMKAQNSTMPMCLEGSAFSSDPLVRPCKYHREIRPGHRLLRLQLPCASLQGWDYKLESTALVCMVDSNL
jgi:hypothetical protein